MLISALAFEDTLPQGEDEAQTLPDLEQQRADVAARATLYRLLAGAFVEEPGIEFLAALREAESLQSLRAAGIAFDADFLETGLEPLADGLACEYATLFASSGGFPPVESVRLMGRFKQEPHFQVVQIYQRLGFQPVRGRFEVFADQLGMELMFVAELLDRSGSALTQGDLPAYKKLDKEIKRFWALHLGRWVRGYSGLIERAARHSFYREMARLLGGFAQEEIAALGLTQLDDLDRGQLEVPKSEIKVEFNPDEPVCGGCTPARPDGAAARVIPIAPLQDLQL